MPLMFISHSSENDAEISAFAEALRAADVRTWIDHENIGPGDDWDHAIETALDAADAMIVALTPDSVKSDEVRSEWRYFLKRHKLVYPVVFDLCKVPYRLEAFQWVDYTRRQTAALRKLIRELNGDFAASDSAAPAPKSESIEGPLVPITAQNARRIAPFRVLTGHRAGVRGLAFNPDGSLLASCAEDSSVRLWYTSGNKPIRPLIGHEKPVLAVAFTPDGTQIASGSEDGTVRLWDVKKRYCITALRGHTAKVGGVTWHPSTSTLLSASSDGSVRLWNPAAREQIGQLEKNAVPAGSLVISPTGQWIALAVVSGPNVELYSAVDWTPMGFIAPKGDVNCLAVNATGSLLATGLEGGGLVLWDMANQTRGGTISYADYNTNCVRGAAFSPDGSLLALGSLDGEIRLWSIEQAMSGKGRALRVLDGHEGGVCGVAFSADGTLLASASLDGTARLWAVTE